MQTATISGIGQIHISADDYSRAVGFYRDVLNLRLLFEVPAQQMAFFDCGGIRLYIGVPSSAEYKANSMLYYRVADIDHAYAELGAKGVTFLHPPAKVHQDANMQLWMAGFRDSEGNYAQLMCEKAV